jgi:outer membrane immunogenic protein
MQAISLITTKTAAKFATTMTLGLLAASLATPSRSADLGGREYYPPAAPVTPRMNLERWTGFYLGGTLGGNFGNSDVTGAFGTGSIDSREFQGTIHAGYNWQIGRMLVGVETDVGNGALSGTVTNGVQTIGIDSDIAGSFRARAGYLMSPSLLVYGTGGVAWARTNIGLDGGERTDQTLTGYQLGLGTELLLNPNWTMRLEYMYTDYGDKALTHSGFTNNFVTTSHAVRAGLSFKF